jgi:hypothetical protein
LVPLPGRSLTLAVLSGTASVRSCEEIGWQAEAPAPPRCKSFECNVGQTLSSVNPAVRPISSQLLSERPVAKEQLRAVKALAAPGNRAGASAGLEPALPDAVGFRWSRQRVARAPRTP